MTREAQQTKNYFRLNGGLNTEINELNFPDGYTRDEQNYELMVDGSRRRRKGLAVEAGAGSAKTVEAVELTSACNSYLWANVDGNPDLNFIVTQIGNTLLFAVDQEAPSAAWKTTALSLQDFSTTGTAADTRDNKVSLSSGRGHLFVTGPYLYPFFVSYNSSTGEVAGTRINIAHRDYEGIDDGTSVTDEPTGTITSAHRYNLRNRGWNTTELSTVLGDLSKHPSRASIPWRGYVRTSDTTAGAGAINPLDGVKSWGASSTKFDAENWGQSSAPQGSIFLNPFDTRYTVGATGGIAIDISTWVVADETVDPWVVTVTATSHGMTHPADVTISGNSYVYNYEIPEGDGTGTGSLNGTHSTVSTADANTFVISTTQPAYLNFNTWSNQYKKYGQIGEAGVTPLAKPDGVATTRGFSAIEYHEGRVFYAGMGNKEYADTIFFSKIAQTPTNYGQCHQEADPTDEHFNAITPADGGFMIIAGMGKVINLVSRKNAILVFATEGIWEISGGQRGVFTADGYIARKITDKGAGSSTSVTRIEDTVIYTGPGGISIIAPNQYTGQLEETSLSQDTIQTLWNGLTVAQQSRVHSVYDDSKRKLYLMYGATATNNLHTNMLILDGRSGGFAKYSFNTATDLGLIGGFAISGADDTTNNKKAKFIYQATATTIQIADFVQTDFLDFDGAESPLPYLVFGHDAMGEFQRRGQAPIITVYSKRTETGYTSTGGGWNPVNGSSTLMTAYWDWTNDSVSGKDGATYPDGTTKTNGQQQVYRHVRQFVPSAAGDVDGYPVVVTRNKVRGRGRALQLRFDGAATKDSHILGLTTNFKITRKK